MPIRQGFYGGAFSNLHFTQMSTIRNRKRTLDKCQKQLDQLLRQFMLSVPPRATQQEAEAIYNRYRDEWQTFCYKMNGKHKWLQADAQAFEKNVALINKHAAKKLQPAKYYASKLLRLVPFILIGAAIYILTDYVLPYFGIIDYRLFQ
jgi:hypothetical protein